MEDRTVVGRRNRANETNSFELLRLRFTLGWSGRSPCICGSVLLATWWSIRLWWTYSCGRTTSSACPTWIEFWLSLLGCKAHSEGTIMNFPKVSVDWMALFSSLRNRAAWATTRIRTNTSPDGDIYKVSDWCDTSETEVKRESAGNEAKWKTKPRSYLIFL